MRALVFMCLTMMLTSPGALAQVQVGEDYRIGPADVLRISVWNDETLSGTVPVRPDGMISLPLLNDVEASGLTPLQLRERLIEQLSHYMPAPEVSVIVEQNGRRLGRLQIASVPNRNHLVKIGENLYHADPAIAESRFATGSLVQPGAIETSGVNPIRMVLFGGAAPVTAGNRRPHSMPPYITWLDDRQVTEVVNYIRSAWGNNARAVTIDDVRDQHGLMLH